METISNGDSDSRRLTFKDISTADIDMLSEYFKNHPSRSCDFSIGGILMWTKYFNYQYAVADDTLFIKGTDPVSGDHLYYQLGNQGNEEAMRLIERTVMSDTGNSRMISPMETAIDAEKPDGTDSEFSDIYREYIYTLEQFRTFAGKKMEKKRNHLHWFLNNVSYRIEAIDETNINQLIAFTEKFMLNHEESELFNYESLETIDVLRHFNQYPFMGILLRDGDNVIGYTFGEVIGDTFFAHVEKGDIDYRGVYQALSSFMAQAVAERCPDVRYINREEDMGNEYLRKSKESYHPIGYVNKIVHPLANFSDIMRACAHNYLASQAKCV